MEIKHTNGLVRHTADKFTQQKFAIVWLNGEEETNREEVIIKSHAELDRTLKKISNYNSAYNEYGLSQRLITI